MEKLLRFPFIVAARFDSGTTTVIGNPGREGELPLVAAGEGPVNCPLR